MLLHEQKQKTRRSKLNGTRIVLKTKFEDLQTKMCVDVEGFMGNTHAYSLDHP
jgi:hypothetical protein